MSTSDTLFIGVKGHVIAFSKRDGKQLWKTPLKGGFQPYDASFVTVLAESERLYVHALGNLFCLDAGTGKILWSNNLKGLGYDIATLAVVGVSAPSIAPLREQKRKAAADSGASGATV